MQLFFIKRDLTTNHNCDTKLYVWHDVVLQVWIIRRTMESSGNIHQRTFYFFR